MTTLAHRSRRRRLLLALLSFLVLALLLVGGVAYYAYSLTRPVTAATGGKAYRLEVKPGRTLASVARELEGAGVVRSADALRTIMRFQGTAGQLKEGFYTFPAGSDAFQVAEVLVGPSQPRIVDVTIPEGKRLKDLPAIFREAGLGNPVTLGTTLENAGLSRYSRGSLEGLLFPATYPFRPEATNAEMVRAMLDRMEQEFTPQRVAQTKGLGLSVRGWVILASLVQAEAANSGEMPTVAGVFLNRLDDGIPLGSDPTVAYGLGKDLNGLDRSAGDFTRDTPYNTYTRQGLPQGPINNPGEAALLSVLSPRRTLPGGGRALYFVHGLDGRIHVNANYAAHLRDVARYR